MGNYFPEITDRVDNFIFAKDGTVWANYLLTGINTNPYKANKISGCQQLNDRLFTALSHLPISDGLLLGLKGQTHPDNFMQRVIHGIPNCTKKNYPDLHKQLNRFYGRMVTGEYAEYERVYWLSLAFPTSSPWYESILSSFAVVDPHRRVNRRELQELEKKFYAAIPNQFRPVRTTPDDVRWVFNRARQRGISVPYTPELYDKHGKAIVRGGGKAAIDGPRAFPQVMINKNADTDALLKHFIAKVKDNNPAVVKRGDKMLRENFRSTRAARALSVSNVETRNIKDFPDGYTSYQCQMAIAKYPEALSYGINSFTYLVDQEIGVDADFALRFHFDQEVIGKDAMRRAMRELNAEDASVSQDEFDIGDFADRRHEMREFRELVKADPAPRGMLVSAVFSFSHQNLEYLQQQVDTLYQHFTDNDFTPYLPVGGQFDLWQAMMPGAACPPALEDLKQVTTTRMFSGYMPVRRTVAGDRFGIPAGLNKENALGQHVLMDLLNATDKGNASIALTAAQGGGKSEMMKVLLGYLNDLGAHTWGIDLSGEYEVYAETLHDVDVVDVAAGRRSLDILKCFPPGQASRIFQDLWLPQLGVEKGSPMSVALSNALNPEYRKTMHITSTRKLIEHLKSIGDEGAREIAQKFLYWANQDYTHAFIDPVIDGVIQDYPAFRSDSRMVIFRTDKLPVYQGDAGRFDIAATDSEKFAAMAYTVIANLVAAKFDEIDGVCVFFGDEMHFMRSDDRVLTQLIEKQDRTGRKNKNWVLAASQLPADLTHHYALVKKKWAGKQETEPNAESALKWVEVPATIRMTEKMITDTSPSDENDNNMPQVGREGEGWYNDGNSNVIRIKWHPIQRDDRRRYADTTSSRRIRPDVLRRQQQEELREVLTQIDELTKRRLLLESRVGRRGLPEVASA